MTCLFSIDQIASY